MGWKKIKKESKKQANNKEALSETIQMDDRPVFERNGAGPGQDTNGPQASQKSRVYEGSCAVVGSQTLNPACCLCH